MGRRQRIGDHLRLSGATMNDHRVRSQRQSALRPGGQGGVAFGAAVSIPQLGGRRELVQRNLTLDDDAGARSIVFKEGRAVGAVGEGDVQSFRVGNGCCIPSPTL